MDRYISEKALIENIAKIEDLRTLSTKTIGEAISNTPTADVVEVVRCKDCAYFIPDAHLDHIEYLNDLEADGFCDNIGKYVDNYEYCSSGIMDNKNYNELSANDNKKCNE